MKRSPILNRKYPQIVYLEHDPVSDKLAQFGEEGVSLVAINVHTGSHHLRLDRTSDWYCIDSAKNFCRYIDQHITRYINNGTGDPITLEEHCARVLDRMIAYNISIYTEEENS